MRKLIDLTTLSATKLHAEIAKRDALQSALLDEVIAAGYGNVRMSEIHALAKAEATPLLVEYCAACDAWYAADDELDMRKRYHGGDKPIKRAVYA